MHTIVPNNSAACGKYLDVMTTAVCRASDRVQQLLMLCLIHSQCNRTGVFPRQILRTWLRRCRPAEICRAQFDVLPAGESIPQEYNRDHATFFCGGGRTYRKRPGSDSRSAEGERVLREWRAQLSVAETYGIMLLLQLRREEKWSMRAEPCRKRQLPNLLSGKC